MTPKRSLVRIAAVAGAAAFLFSLAHVSPAAAQTTTPHQAFCMVELDGGISQGECTIAVPAGKRFVIESATAGGVMSSTQWARVQILTRINGNLLGHFVPAGFYDTNLNYPHWTGAMPGKLVAESPSLKLRFTRGSGTAGNAWMALTVSGYLEDM